MTLEQLITITQIELTLYSVTDKRIQYPGREEYLQGVLATLEEIRDQEQHND